MQFTARVFTAVLITAHTFTAVNFAVWWVGGACATGMPHCKPITFGLHSGTLLLFDRASYAFKFCVGCFRFGINETDFTTSTSIW